MPTTSDNSKANTSHAFFCLTCRSKQDVAEVSRALGLEPSQVVVTSMEDPSAPFGVTNFHLWQFDSPLPESADPNDHIERLVEVLSPRAEDVRRFTERLEGRMHCHITYRNPPCPAELCLWKPTVQALAKMGLAVSFDVFFLPDPKLDGPDECY